ncbi:hypothetical protein COCON_G00000480 [Conger conger]|uniref:Uncharacterized protein n=1 Tax=Conger conger TaxID=82655 RepID=A0A9Q1E0J8_CONCO|nr:hypothetical protein COCON_G00000480 [Conger conger]
MACAGKSKRKVLGWRCEEERVAGPSPTGPSLRSLRRCVSSCAGFKALLLRKGSRSDRASRLSAAEILQRSAPRYQRSQSQPAAPPPGTRAARPAGEPHTPPPAGRRRHCSRFRLVSLSLIPECTALEETHPLWGHASYEDTPSLQTCPLSLAPPPWGEGGNWADALPPSAGDPRLEHWIL